VTSPRIRAASFEDYAEIAALEARFSLDVRSRAEWSHFWLGNPAFLAMQHDWPIGWVLEDQDRIVASMANIPLLYELGGGKILAATGRGWVAETAYRSHSLLLLDSVISQPGVDLFVNTTVSPASLPAVELLNCHRVPVGLWDTSSFWITDHQGFVESVLRPKTGRLARPLSYPLSVAVSLKDWLARQPVRERDVELELCAEFDERFDGFWDDLRRSNPHVLLAARTSQVLRWHFQHVIKRNQLWIVTVKDRARISAYCIFDVSNNLKSGMKRARLIDFQTLDGGTEVLSPMLLWALKKCRSDAIHILECTGRWIEENELIFAAAHTRRLSAWSYYYRANNPTLATTLTDSRAWRPTLLDGDASL